MKPNEPIQPSATPRTVADLMREPVEAVPVGAKALEARWLMDAREIRHLAVVDAHGVLVGVVSDRDLRAAGPSRLLLTDDKAREKALSVIPVAGAMTPAPVTVTPGTPLAVAIRLLLRRRVGCLMVTDPAGHPVGILTASDVMRLALGFLERAPDQVAPPR